MIGLGVGSMFSVSVLQLIPESLDVNTEEFRSRILVIIASIYVFYLADCLTTLARYKNMNIHNDTLQNGNVESNEMLTSDQIQVQSIQKIKHVPTVVWLIVICDSLHNFVDGLAIAAALSSGSKEGMAIFIAILFEEIPCEIGDFAVFMKSGLRLRLALLLNFASSTTNYIGVIVGFLIVNSELIRSWIYGIAAGMFLYISLGVLLSELNDQGRRIACKSKRCTDPVDPFATGDDINRPDSIKGRLFGILCVQNLGILCGCGIQILIMMFT